MRLILMLSVLTLGCKKKNQLKYLPNENWTINDSLHNAVSIEISDGSTINNYLDYSFDAADANKNAISIILNYNSSGAISGNYSIISADSTYSFTDSSKYCTLSISVNNGTHFCYPVGKSGDSVNVLDANGELKISMSNITMRDSSNMIYSLSASFYQAGQ
jgi:hypothetical protein